MKCPTGTCLTQPCHVCEGRKREMEDSYPVPDYKERPYRTWTSWDEFKFQWRCFWWHVFNG